MIRLQQRELDWP